MLTDAGTGERLLTEAEAFRAEAEVRELREKLQRHGLSD